MTLRYRREYEYLEFMGPLSSQRASKLTAFIADNAAGTVVDVGCGWGQFLNQVLARKPSLQGVGIDHDAENLRHALKVAKSLGVADRVKFIDGDAKRVLPETANAAICIGASHAWGASAEDSLPMDYGAALHTIRRLVPRGSPVVYGEQIWSREPTEAATRPLAGRLDEFIRLPELLELAWGNDFAVIQVHEANLDEWDEFESGFAAAYSDWLLEHPADHPDAAQARSSADRQRKAYFEGYRGILGMAYLALVAA